MGYETNRTIVVDEGILILLYCRYPSGWLVRRAVGNYHAPVTICKGLVSFSPR